VAQAKPAREPPLPAGSAFLKKIISTRTGERDYRLFVPSSGKPRGLVVMLHGCKQHAEDFALGTAMNTVAEKESMLMAYPTQSHVANVSGCWNWFQPEHQERDGGEPHIIAEMTRAVIAEYGLGPRVYVAGLSAGGAMAAVMGTNYPDLYEAIGIHSGLPYRSAHDVNSAFAAMRGAHGHQRPGRGSRPSPALPRQIVFHGTQDHTVVPENAMELMDTVRRAHGGGIVEEQRFSAGSRFVQHSEYLGTDGKVKAETWLIEGAGHYWSGGDPAGSYAKAEGPCASREMMRFFLGRRRER
jgi:poly(hydroxyalkanoate) depolymerase family esterase